MEVTGKLKQIDDTKKFGAKEFKKRECRVTTNDQYPQIIPIEFVQDKCDLLDNYKVGDDVKISINLRGNEWINLKGEVKCFPSIQGWRIEKDDLESIPPPVKIDTVQNNEVEDDLPF